MSGPARTGDVVPYPLRWAAATVLLAGVLMDLIDGSIVNVALPRIHADLHASGAQVQWVVSAYMLAFAAVLITAGSLGDLFGRKRLFLAGTALFALASLGAGVSQSAGELIVARTVQGAAAGVMTPQLLASFRSMFAGAELGRAFGLYGMMGGFATALGLLAGGALTTADVFGWQWRTVFLVNLPIALATLAAGLVPGLAVAGVGLSLLIIPLANVVLAAVPAAVAGGASGIFSTVQQIGGAVGVASLGSVFFGYVQPHGYRAAFIHTAPAVAGVFLLAALIAVVLPSTALDENEALELEYS